VVISGNNLYMIFEYLNMDLKKLMDKKKDVFTPQLIKVCLLLLKVIVYCNSTAFPELYASDIRRSWILPHQSDTASRSQAPEPSRGHCGQNKGEIIRFTNLIL